MDLDIKCGWIKSQTKSITKLNIYFKHTNKILLLSQNDTSFENPGKTSCLRCTCPLLYRRRKKFNVIVDVVRHSSFNSKYVARNNSLKSNSFRQEKTRSNEKVRYRRKSSDVIRNGSLKCHTEMNRRRNSDIGRTDSFRIWNEVMRKRSLTKT